MIDLKWIEKAPGFPEADPKAESYFERPEENSPLYAYEADTLPALRKLLEERLGDLFTPAERLEIAKLAFRCKPVPSEETAPEDRQIADFIYQL